jgi:hypothetical protein
LILDEKLTNYLLLGVGNLGDKFAEKFSAEALAGTVDVETVGVETERCEENISKSGKCSRVDIQNALTETQIDLRVGVLRYEKMEQKTFRREFCSRETEATFST